MKYLIAILLFLFGEAIIVTTMLFLPVVWEQAILITNIVVLTIIWAMNCYDIVLPLAKKKQEASDAEVGHLGIRWQGQFIYSLLAITILVLGAIFTWPFIWQITAQACCLGLLFFMFLFAYYSRRAIRHTATREQAMIDGRESMKKAVKRLQDILINCDDATETMRTQISDIQSQLRYITPSSTPEAKELEDAFLRLAEEIHIALPHARTDAQQIEMMIARMQRTLSQRKQLTN